MTIEENHPGPDHLEDLRAVLQGLDIYSLALVWDFAQYLLKLQVRIEVLNKAREN
ncbi:unnamed protein product [marine sediment metagenome]|uniref:Uncharacterized protein n=1 Tax=marine sediment metagenome TaxID=412755 RepID=X1PVQ3_9ZZZZ